MSIYKLELYNKHFKMTKFLIFDSQINFLSNIVAPWNISVSEASKRLNISKAESYSRHFKMSKFLKFYGQINFLTNIFYFFKKLVNDWTFRKLSYYSHFKMSKFLIFDSQINFSRIILLQGNISVSGRKKAIEQLQTWAL